MRMYVRHKYNLNVRCFVVTARTIYIRKILLVQQGVVVNPVLEAAPLRAEYER